MRDAPQPEPCLVYCDDLGFCERCIDMDVAGDDEEEFDCGMLRSGQCLKAGSGQCDWMCPNGAVSGLRRRLHAR